MKERTKMQTEQWTMTANAVPPEGKVVMAMGNAGYAQPLKRQGRLWFFADGSMYVYFTPRCWRELTPAEGKEEKL